MEIKYILSAALHYMAIALFLRSLFYLIRARKGLTTKDFIALVIPLFIGIGFLLYQTNDLDDVMTRFPYIGIFHAGCSYSFYLLAKYRKEKEYNLEAFVSEELSCRSELLLKKISRDRSTKIESINYSDVSNLSLNKLYKANGDVGVMRVESPDESLILLKVFMMPGSYIPAIKLKGAHAICFVDKGRFYDSKVKEEFNTNNKAIWIEDESHSLRVKEYSELRAYFKESK